MKALEVSSAIDNHLKPIQIEGASSPIEISNLDTRINTNLQIAGDINVSGEAVFSKAVEIEDSLRIRGTENYIYATELMSLHFHEASSIDYMQFYGQRLLVDGKGYETLGGASGSTGVSIWSPDGYDSFVALYEHLGLKWTIGQDSDDSNNLKFDYGAATGGATKLTLDGSGNLTASNSLVVGNATLTTSELDCSSGSFTVDVASTINLDSNDGTIYFRKAGNYMGGISAFLSGEYEFTLVSDSNILDRMYIRVYDNGATLIETVDADAALAHLTLDPDGDLIISGADTKIDAAKKLYLDGGTHTYIEESSDDVVQVYAGGDKIVELTEATTGNVADFGTTGVGFTQFEPTYNASDTNVNFNDNGNKAFITFGAGNITDMNLYFPNVSCNCVLLLKQDGSGSRTVTNWKTFDQADGNESTVVWAGGSAPTLTTTASKLDILSFYWDNDNHKAYGVATLNF